MEYLEKLELVMESVYMGALEEIITILKKHAPFVDNYYQMNISMLKMPKMGGFMSTLMHQPTHRSSKFPLHVKIMKEVEKGTFITIRQEHNGTFFALSIEETCELADKLKEWSLQN